MKPSTLSMAIAASLVIFSPNFAKSADTYDARNDAIADPAPQGTSVDWSGFYVGGRVGYGNANNELSVEDLDPLDPNPVWEETAILNGLGSEGFIGGGQLGIDKQFGRFVLGVLGSYDWSNVESEISSLGVSDVGTITDGKLTKEEEWSLGARAGVLVNDSTLIYMLAAYTETEYALTGGDSAWAESVKFQGISVGGGIEFALAKNIFLGLEGTHTFYDEEILAFDEDGGSPADDADRVVSDLNETKIMGTLKIKLTSF